MSKRALETAGGVAKKARTDASPKQASLDAFVRKSPASTSKPVGSTSKAVAIPTVDIDAFRSGLSTEDRELLSLELDTLDRSWLPVLLPTIRSTEYKQLKRFLWQQNWRGADHVHPSIFPPAADVFTWSRYTPLSTDPYHGPGQAHGLCFSVRPGVKIPPSLKNIYKELQTDFPDFKPPSHGFLGSWARNGVLLLNSSLTVKSGEAQSHANKGWEALTSAVVDAVAKHSPGAVWLAWGLPAQKRVAKVDTRKHLVLKSAHPSPLSASRGFFGNGHFVKANAWLQDKYGDAGPIDWTKLETSEPDAPSAPPLPGAPVASTSAAA